MTETASGPGLPSNVERILLRIVLVLCLIGATLTIWVIFGGDLGRTQARILASSFGVALYVAIALGCAAVSKRQPTSLGARLGLIVCFGGALVFVIGVWTDAINHAWWWKLLGITFIVGVACAHASFLLLIKLSERFAIVRVVTRVGIYGCALLLTAMIIFGLDGTTLWRLVGVLSTIAMFGTAAMPILARLSVSDSSESSS